MYERVRFALPLWPRPRAGAVFRYELLDRIRRCGSAHAVTVLAFGFEGPRHLRCVLRGRSDRVAAAVKGVKVGTALALRHRGLDGGLGVPQRSRDAAALDAVVWAHRAPLQGPRGPRQPLATPWSSHRDLMGCREAVFFDAKPLRGAVDPSDVDERCGGTPAPRPEPPPERWSLATLLRIAGAVLGVVPSDRRCFGLFVHLAHEVGWPTREIAAALCLTPRRVRQLAARPAPHFALARRALVDPRLQRVP